ncbi:MAG: 50S ribosomal protein L10 [bacterium]|nr:50S ribosomal protein L10 [bacterium]
MAISKSKKEEIVSQIASEFKNAKLSVLTDYRGLSAEEMNELRTRLREAGISYKVVKNTLIKLAIKKTDLSGIDSKIFDGPMAIAFGDDEITAAKIIATYAKEHGSLEIISAITNEAKILSANGIRELASLPSHEELLAKVTGTIAAPLSGFVNVLGGNLRNLVYALNAIKGQKS